MLDANGLYLQSIMTGKDRFEHAESYLKNETEYEATFDNVMRLAELMNKDFSVMLMNNGINDLASCLDDIKHEIWAK